MPPLHCPARHCPTCPYSRDTPPGIWARDEYEKLPGWDEGAYPIQANTFRCHQETATGRPTVCVGWLAVNIDSIAVRVALAEERLTREDVDRIADADFDLYETGAQACAAGLAALDDPPLEALLAMQRLVRKGIGQTDPPSVPLDQDPQWTTSCAVTDAGADPTEPAV